MGKTAFLFLITLWSGAHALQTYPLIDQNQTTFNVSQKELNRIAISGDRIQQIFGSQGHLEIQSDEDNGQIFISFIRPKTVTLTLITESGMTHDCTLIPEDIPFQSILFKPHFDTEQAPETKGISPLLNASKKDRLKRLIQTMASGEAMQGYTLSRLTNTERTYLGFSLKPSVVYQGAEENGYVYIIRNQSDQKLALSSKELALPKDIALHTSKNSLLSGESCWFYVVERN